MPTLLRDATTDDGHGRLPPTNDWEPDRPDDAVPLPHLASRLCAGAVAISAATASWLVLVAEFDRRRGWAVPGVTSCAQWLSWQCGISPGTARDHVRVARALPALPRVAEELQAGRISFAKARAIVRVADPGTEDVLLQVAEHCTAAQLERVVAGWRRSDTRQTENARRRSEMAEQEAREDALAEGANDDQAVVAGRRAAAAVWLDGWPDGADPDRPATRWDQRFDWRDEGDGSVTLRIRLSAEHAAELVAAVEHRAEVLTRRDRVEQRGQVADIAERRRARVTVARTTALLDLVRAGAVGTGVRPGDPARREVVVRVDAVVLADDAAAGQAALDGVAALSPAQARRLACDASLTVVLVEGEQVLACGRRRRFATAGQRRALLVRDGGCARPGCAETRPERLHAHHLVSWLAGGRTDVDNLVLLCDRCHGMVHDLDLTLRRTASGQLMGWTTDGTPAWAAADTDGADRALPPRDDLPGSWRPNGERLDVRYALGVLLDNRSVLRRRLQAEQVIDDAA